MRVVWLLMTVKVSGQVLNMQNHGYGPRHSGPRTLAVLRVLTRVPNLVLVDGLLLALQLRQRALRNVRQQLLPTLNSEVARLFPPLS